jgi:hypothetical protein
MNYVVIILGVIVILLIYTLIRMLMATSVDLTASANLNDSITGFDIKNSPTSTRYAYGLWIYVNSWNASTPKSIFKRENNIELSLDASSPILNCDITMSDDSTKTIEITDNFPLQKWTHIIVSVDNQYVDCYIDGKLVRSGRVYKEDATAGISVPKPPPPVANKMYLAKSTKYDAYVARFKHWSSPINPETAWSTYMQGNGQSTFKNWLSAYGLDILIKKDNVEQTKMTLF